jgi:galactose-1-phosphate uridylyltransferase
MPDYKFVNIPSLENWIVSAPKRAKRPDIHKKKLEKKCPFCPATQSKDEETYRLGGEYPD